MSVVSGDTVTVMLISDDGIIHSWFLDFNNNNVVDSNEMATFSGFFTSTTTFLNFTWTPTIGVNIPSGGNWTYKCSVHPFSMFGTCKVIPAQITSTVLTTLSLDSSRVTTDGTLVLDTRSSTVSGLLTVTALNVTTGATLFTKTYIVPSLLMRIIPGTATSVVRLLLNVAVLPYSLSSDITLQFSGFTLTTSIGLTRQLDINQDGSVDIVDFGAVAFAYGSTTGTPRFNPILDFDADGNINIIDFSIIALFYASTNLR